MPRYAMEESDFESFIRRGYLHVYVPSRLRPQLVKAAKILGFGSLADLTRHALREYLERRALMTPENKIEEKAGPPAPATGDPPGGGPRGEERSTGI